MTQFEFFMTFYGLLLGLAVAELLLGFGNLLRGRRQPSWGILTPLLGLLIFFQIITSFLDAWLKLQHVPVDLRGMAAPALIGVSYLTAALMAVPRDIDEWPSLDEYFHARKWFTLGSVLFSSLLSILFVDLALVVEGRAAAIIAYVLLNGLALTLLTIPLLTRSRRIAASSMGALIVLVVFLYATQLRISGLVERILGI